MGVYRAVSTSCEWAMSSAGSRDGGSWSWGRSGVHIPFCNLTCDGSSAVADINAENCLVVGEGGRGSCIGAARSPWDRGLVVFPLVDKVFSGRCHTKGGRLPDENGLVCGLSNNHRRSWRWSRGWSWACGVAVGVGVGVAVGWVSELLLVVGVGVAVGVGVVSPLELVLEWRWEWVWELALESRWESELELLSEWRSEWVWESPLVSVLESGWAAVGRLWKLPGSNRSPNPLNRKP